MTTIAIANRKGGVGKTTIAVALAVKLAETERVLLIDLDSQANATEALSVALQPGVFMWLGADTVPDLAHVGALDVLPGNVKTENVNLILSSDGDVMAIERGINRLGRYDHVILDCPPSLSMLTRAAIFAADYVLCPTVPEYLGVAGVRQLVTQTAQIKERFGRPVRLLGIQPNMYRRTTKEHHENLTDMVRAYGAWGHGDGRVWPPLRQSIDVARAIAEGRPLWDVLTGQVLDEWLAMVERVRSYD